MRVLIADHAAAPVRAGDEIREEDLDALYAHPGPLLRLNFVTTLDGAASGADGRSGTINSPADHLGFRAMRRAADVILVGGGTARAEGYGPVATPIVVVSGRAEPPETTRGPNVVLATTHSSGAVDGEAVWICGQHRVDPVAVVERARTVFGPHLLCEGGPTLAADLVTAGLVDELGLSWTPRLVGGGRSAHPRLLEGAELDAHLTCRHLLEEDGTLLGLWGLDDPGGVRRLDVQR